MTYQVVRCKVIRETRFNDTFYYFWYKREVGNWAVFREFIFVQCRFLEERWYDRFFESVVKVTRAKWQINYVSDSRNQECRAYIEKPRIGIGSESHCLLGQLNKILEISDSEAGLKVEKSGLRGCFRRRRWMRRWWCRRTNGQRETKFRYFVSEERTKKQGYQREHWLKCR